MTLHAPHQESLTGSDSAASTRFRLLRLLRWALFAAAGVFFVLHFLHLTADFPDNSPWVDWSKYTDEGWYGDAAIRHYLTGHWYWPGDFNPAVALPVWPLIELVVFRFTGVSPTAARALTLCVFALTIFLFARLMHRFEDAASSGDRPSFAAAIAALLFCASPYFYVFERMAILEPLLIALTALALLIASHLRPLRARHAASWLPSLALGVLLPAMVLTKTTAVFLLPAIGYMVWAGARYRLRTALRFSILPAAVGAGIWLSYFFFFVRPHYLEDYNYLFAANAYSGIELRPLGTVIVQTISDGGWMGHVLYPLFFVVLALALFWRPGWFRNPLVPALLLWIGGYFVFLAYHNNLQPRYYLVVAAPITVLVAMGIDFFVRPPEWARRSIFGAAVAATLASIAVLAIVIPDARLQIGFVRHPGYTFEAALHGIQRIVLADPTHSHLVLSISGSDLTLMTGLPSIDDDFGTLDLDQRVKQYRPGWYAAWNELDDDKMDALTPLYHPVRVAAFPSMDDPDRNLLILYRLDPKEETPAVHINKPRPPRPLRTRLGQQPTTQQLTH